MSAQSRAAVLNAVLDGLHPVVCPCGWTGAPQTAEWAARVNLDRHQRSLRCPVVTPPRPPGHTTINPGCTATTGACTCLPCRLAATDDESPLDLGGRWVRRGGVRVWEGA